MECLLIEISSDLKSSVFIYGNYTSLVPAHAADKDNVSDVRFGDLRVLQGLGARVHSLLDEVGNDAFELGSRHL